MVSTCTLDPIPEKTMIAYTRNTISGASILTGSQQGAVLVATVTRGACKSISVISCIALAGYHVGSASRRTPLFHYSIEAASPASCKQVNNQSHSKQLE